MIRADARPRYTYVILVTALTGKGSYLEGMEAGADDFVSKPFDLDEMAARLRVARRIIGLQSEIRQLQGLLPLCSYCRRIRDDGTTGPRSRTTSPQRTDVMLSRSICPDCYHSKIGPEIESARNRRPSAHGDCMTDLTRWPPADVAILDEAALEAIREVQEAGAPDLVAETVELFLGTTPERSRRCEPAVARGRQGDPRLRSRDQGELSAAGPRSGWARRAR